MVMVIVVVMVMVMRNRTLNVEFFRERIHEVALVAHVSPKPSVAVLWPPFELWISNSLLTSQQQER